MENPFCKGPSTLDWSCNVKKSYKVCTLPGDGIGPEVIAEGKKVLIQVFAKDDIVTVSVTNYGYVIPAEELPLIFNKFYRVEQSRSSKTGGTGLGLAIAKNIVDMHGGTISVASDLNGTVFTVKLKVDFDVNKENFGMIQ